MNAEACHTQFEYIVHPHSLEVIWQTPVKGVCQKNSFWSAQASNRMPKLMDKYVRAPSVASAKTLQAVTEIVWMREILPHCLSASVRIKLDFRENLNV